MIVCRTYMIIDKLLANAIVSQLGADQNPTTALYSETAKPKFL